MKRHTCGRCGQDKPISLMADKSTCNKCASADRRAKVQDLLQHLRKAERAEDVDYIEERLNS